MRDRNRFANRKRGPKPSQPTDRQRFGEDPHQAGGRKRRRDRKSSGGNLFAFLGFGKGGNDRRGSKTDQRSSAKTSGRRHSATPTASNRLVTLPPRRSAASARSPVRPAAAVVPFERQGMIRNRRPSRRRSAAAPAPARNLVQLPAPRSKSGKLMLYAARLMVLGVGIGVLAGTMLSVWDPASRLTAGSTPNAKPATAQVKPAETLQLGQELVDLKGKVATLVAQQKDTKAGVMLLDLDTNAYVDINASEVFPAASTIKFPILVAFFQEVDADKLQLSESLVMKKEQVATESGDMQYQPVGTTFSAIETATQMMVVSDNTATNMVIDRLGGMTALNQRFKSWGLSATLLANPLPDVKATNTTSPKDLATLMSQVQNGKLVSMKSRDRLLEIMRRIENDTLLPQGLDKGATIAHKTGTLGGLLGDIGLIDTPTGKRYLASVLVKRQRNDPNAEKLVQQISRLAYQRFNQPGEAAQKFDRARIAQPPN
jgi:beta-lactamase class A